MALVIMREFGFCFDVIEYPFSVTSTAFPTSGPGIRTFLERILVRGSVVEWVSAPCRCHLIYFCRNRNSIVGSSPAPSRRETSLRSINTGMSLVSFVQGLILEHQSLTIWWGRWVSIYALMTAPIS